MCRYGRLVWCLVTLGESGLKLMEPKELLVRLWDDGERSNG